MLRGVNAPGGVVRLTQQKHGCARSIRVDGGFKFVKIDLVMQGFCADHLSQRGKLKLQACIFVHFQERGVNRGLYQNAFSRPAGYAGRQVESADNARDGHHHVRGDLPAVDLLHPAGNRGQQLFGGPLVTKNAMFHLDPQGSQHRFRGCEIHIRHPQGENVG